jgi:hypothetical protein
MQKFTEICPAGAELFHAGKRADGRGDLSKLMAPFRNFANVPKKNTAFRN